MQTLIRWKKPDVHTSKREEKTPLFYFFVDFFYPFRYTEEKDRRNGSMDTLKWIDETTAQLPEGAFLMVKGNPMTIGWGQFGILWRTLCATVYVRHSRYTHELLEDCDTFTISVPDPGAMKQELAFCGTKSGRDFDKCKEINRSLVPAVYGAQDGLEGCRYQIECKILHRSELDISLLEDPAIIDRHYRSGDTHTMYIGQVLGVTEFSSCKKSH